MIKSSSILKSFIGEKTTGNDKRQRQTPQVYWFIQQDILLLGSLLKLGYSKGLKVLFPDVEVDAVEDLVPALSGAAQLVPVKVCHVRTLQGKGKA